MTTVPPIIAVDQALFGYSDGHRLLASSLSLSARDSYELAARSDLVPGANLEQDASYLTGFTLPESGVFAFIRTWLAPEMPRAGCVWSHVLLLPKAFLARQVDLGVLAGQFRRPYRASSQDGYSKKLKLEPVPAAEVADPLLVAEILAAYYEPAEILRGRPPDEEFGRALLAIWSQQWPKLRSEFSFRTIFGSAVSLDKGLNIRVSPNQQARGFISDPNAWLAEAVDDAISPSITPLRRFLWRYGKDTAQPRRSFKDLVQLYVSIRRSGGRVKFDDVSWLINKKRDPKHATTLKLDLLGFSPPALSMVPMIDARGYARFLDFVSPLERQVAGRDDLMKALGKLDQRELVTIASAMEQKQTDAVDLQALEEAIIYNARWEALTDPELPVATALKILRNDPGYIADYDLRRLTLVEAAALLDISADPNAKTRLLERVLSDIATPQLIPAVVSQKALTLCAAANLSIAGQLHQSWAGFLGNDATSLLADGLGGLNGVEAVSHAAQFLGFPLGSAVRASEWSDAAGKERTRGRSDDLTIVSAFIFVLCYQQGMAANMALAGRYLSHLRQAAIVNAIPHKARAFLEQHLPSTSENWDINKRLLKVLRRSAREGSDVSSALAQLSLTQEETAYAMGWEAEHKGFDLSALLRLFRN